MRSRTHPGPARLVVARTIGLTVLAYITVGLLMALVVRHIALPDGQVGLDASFGSFNSFLQETSGRWVTTDIQLDFASAAALLHGQDPYAPSAALFDQFAMPAWDVRLANPHPPTTMPLLMPFALISYQNALTAWTVLMVFAVIATIQLLGVRLAYAAPLGVAICIVFPATYGIGNVVPVIGLGIALAYRFRDNPLMAAIGLTLAAAPKASGLLLLLPFVLSLRFRTVLWTAAFMIGLALLPLAFYWDTWSRYLDVGVESITLNAARPDNAAILNLATKVGFPSVLAIGLIVLAAAGAALLMKDSFWPTVWLIVALLPIAWTYSMITLIPLFCVAVRRPNPWGVGAVAIGTALAVGSPPLGMWPTRVVPLIVLCAFVAMLQISERAFWPDRAAVASLLRRSAIPASDRTSPDSADQESLRSS